MNREDVLAQFPTLFPLAVEWATGRERLILERGVGLTPDEVKAAQAIGLRNTDQVRLLPVTRIPRPEDPRLRAACDAINFLNTETRGLTLGYGIFIREDCGRDPDLVAHELVHTAQYERFGGIEPFLQRYLTECLTVGYENSPLEQEARKTAAQLHP
jgi:hypothetical protein